MCVCMCVCACVATVADLVQSLLWELFDAVGNAFLILLLVLYLLFEQASHPVGTLRRKLAQPTSMLCLSRVSRVAR